MKYEAIVSVDEETKKFMGFIDEEIRATISEGITGALRKTNSGLDAISDNQNTILLSVKGISKISEKIPSAIEESREKAEQTLVRELLKNQQLYKDLNESTKTVILTEQKIVNEALLKSNSDLKEISGKANTYLLSLVGTSKSIEKIPSAIEESQEKAEQTLTRELLKNQQLYKDLNEDIKTVIITEQKIVNEALLKNNSELKGMSEKANTILLSVEGSSKTIGNLPSSIAIEQLLKNTEQTIINELLKNQQLYKEINEDTKAAIFAERKLVLKEITKLNDTFNENQVNIFAKLSSFEEKLGILSDILDGQSHLLQRLEKIEGKVNDLKLPFYKRWFSKGVS